ncbi:hypothetical protein NDU88_004662 [Pleurodeles waltl]|uniref:Uncharacterized protein n=1 Tax=Pleurodeles waltl TaxID=8319 RepID=A0AAV7NKA8_PLEWA|nr:hypothetical protein NDU88_004662 [Pleurodeles waltl]
MSAERRHSAAREVLHRWALTGGAAAQPECCVKIGGCSRIESGLGEHPVSGELGEEIRVLLSSAPLGWGGDTLGCVRSPAGWRLCSSGRETQAPLSGHRRGDLGGLRHFKLEEAEIKQAKL